MNSLQNRFLDPTNFELAWDKVATNQGCAGVDGETIYAFGLHKSRNLTRLLQQVATSTYRPLPLRQFFIPKKSGGWRELGVPTVRDRIVQQALLQVLHPVFEVEFEPQSYAYRPGRSHRMAVERVAHWRSRGYDWVLDADIVKYFDTLQHPRLLAEVKERLNQPWVLALLQGWITAGTLTREGILLPTCGVPQGSPISPLLANVYLDDFDELLTQAGHKLVRYADDFVVLARTQQRLVEAQTYVAQLLEGMGLSLHPNKTQITTFDRGFRFLGHAFAGDVVVPLSPRRPQALTPNPSPNLGEGSTMKLTYADGPAQSTAIQQALVEALKRSQQPIPPPLFVVLGYQVRADVRVALESQEITWRNGMSSLYVVEQGAYLHKDQGRLVLKAPRAKDSLEIPLAEVERILLFGNVQLTTAVIAACLQQQIPVIFLSQLGDYKGHLWSAEITDLTAEAEQFARQHDEAFGCTTARAVVYGKLWNSKIFLLRQNRKRQFAEVRTAIERLDGALTTLAGDAPLSLEQIRGYEGNGASEYFQTFGPLITNPGFSWAGRNFHPPTDPVNSLLSFGYTLLFNNVFSLLLVEGLNPYLGHLHGAERQKAYLAFDLMEEFRSPVVDALVMRLINQKIIRPTDFSWPKENNGVYLTDPARRVFLRHFEQRITEKVTHPDVKEPVSYRRVIQLQVKRYKRAVLGNQPYKAFERMR
ncbi:CRISPR-associated endonuclease Cas1 [Nodosilinea nodulosa]|uniref:CRISPR-associated endonuclease Cas1 n=1 Tax=Nodosilinea nodulosa TaxID=416001 RepID=UPI0003149CCB|nr:CRISPR-associated endonuclease Cas1 [Nodosilinea nodulosa]